MCNVTCAEDDGGGGGGTAAPDPAVAFEGRAPAANGGAAATSEVADDRDAASCTKTATSPGYTTTHGRMTQHRTIDVDGREGDGPVLARPIADLA